MHMKWMRSSNETARNVDLDNLVSGNGNHGSRGKQVVSVASAAEDLKQDRNRGWFKNRAIEGVHESMGVEAKVKVDSKISTVRVRLPWSKWTKDWV